MTSNLVTESLRKPRIAQDDLLRGVANELANLREVAILVQEATCHISEAKTLNTTNMRQLQKLDYVTQAIDDLERVVRYVSDCAKTTEFDNQSISTLIRLGSVRESLLFTSTQEGEVITSDGEVSLF